MTMASLLADDEIFFSKSSADDFEVNRTVQFEVNHEDDFQVIYVHLISNSMMQITLKSTAAILR